MLFNFLGSLIAEPALALFSPSVVGIGRAFTKEDLGVLSVLAREICHAKSRRSQRGLEVN